MAFLQIDYKSEALMRGVNIKVILPSDGMAGKWEPPYKTLYLLPGYSATATELITYLGLRGQSELKGIAIVLPDGENLFYQDLPDRMTFYSTYVGKELVEVTRKMLPLSTKREDTFIGGISMGGYGALYNGFKYRDTFSKVVAFSPATVMVVGCFTGCGSDKKNDSSEVVSTEQSGSKEETPEFDMSETVKMGILVSDATSAEALAFRTYYTEYIQKQYNVELIYSDELKDAAGETSAIDTFITNNCKAIISFSSFDRAAQIEQCEAAGVYYAVATGTLTDEEYETYKGYEHYVGAIGPSLEVEYQTGYDMANYYLEQGKKNFAIFGGAIPYYTDMHIYRAAGMIAAMVDAGGADANYKGATDEAGIIGQIYADGQIETGAIGDVNIVGYVGGYDMDDAWFGKCAQMAQTPDLEVILAVGNGSDFFGTAIEGTDVKIASVDAYAESYGTAMDGGMLDYLAGKFSASIGPIFIATYRAVLGSPIRTEDGNALALSQGYWVATSPEEFSEYYAVDSSVDSPAYTKGMLDGLLTADYASFEKFVSAYGFKDIQEEAK